MPNPSSFDPEEIVAALSEFYQFLSRLPWIEPSDVLYPPEGGWPTINQANFAALGKNDDVIALLRRLPYIRMDTEQYVVAYSTYPCDYRRDPSTFLPGGWEVPVLPEGFEFPAWVVPLTYGKNHGDYLMLDTTDGTVISYPITGGGYPPEYAADDPRSWRNECVPPAAPLREFLGKWREEYDSLRWIGFPMAGWPYIWVEGMDGFDEMRDIMRSHGWPHAFQRDACKAALADWEMRFRQRER